MVYEYIISKPSLLYRRDLITFTKFYENLHLITYSAGPMSILFSGLVHYL